MNYQAIIFDLDGVLCYTDTYHYQAWKQIADEEHIYFDEEINRRLRGVSRTDSLNIILERAERVYTEKEKAELARRKNEIYVSLLQSMTKESLADGAIETLECIKSCGIKTAVGSSSKNAPLILQRLGLEKYFEAVSDGNGLIRSKPNPEVFLKAAEMLNKRPCECWVVEDAKAGIEAAYRGGFFSAAIGDARNHIKATYAIGKLSDLVKIVEAA